MENRRNVAFFAVLAGLLAAGIAMYFNQNPNSAPNIQGKWRHLLGLVAIIFILGSIVFVFARLFSREAKQRKEAWLEKADAIEDAVNLDFEEDVPKHFHRDFLYLPQIKKSGKTKRIARGTIANREALFFEHAYVVSTGQTTYTVTHCVYSTEAPNWPDLRVTPRGALSKLMRKLGRRSGMLLDDPGFNHAFVVKAEDEPFAVTLLTPEMQRFMLDKPNARWRIANSRVFLIYNGALKLDRMPVSVDRLARFWSFVQPEVKSWQRRGMF